MSWSQLDQLEAQGNDVGGQTIDHPDLTTLTQAQMQQELCGSRQDLIANGIHGGIDGLPTGITTRPWKASPRSTGGSPPGRRQYL